MRSAIEALERIASPSLGTPGGGWAALPAALRPLYARKDGFYAFEGALHVFPRQGCGAERGLEEWNSHQLWRFEYGELTSGLFFFAEDAFGGQFCVHEGGIASFEPETGELELLAPDVTGWAERLLENYALLTGHALMREWQQAHGPIQVGRRLLPGQPFVLGGDFTVANLAAVDAVEGMRSRGNIARQLRHLPDGTRVRLRVR